MNRNVLKIIALVTMLIDHIGIVFFPEVLVFRIIGRISFPLFAYFIAEGYYHTSNRKRYVLMLFVFMLISWVPFNLALGLSMFTFNVLGIFLLSIMGMFIVDKIKYNSDVRTLAIISFCFYIVVCMILTIFELLPETLLGVLLPVVFYAFRDKACIKYVMSSIVLILMSCLYLIDGYQGFCDLIQFFSLLAIILIVLIAILFTVNKDKYGKITKKTNRRSERKEKREDAKRK